MNLVHVVSIARTLFLDVHMNRLNLPFSSDSSTPKFCIVSSKVSSTIVSKLLTGANSQYDNREYKNKNFEV